MYRVALIRKISCQYVTNSHGTVYVNSKPKKIDVATHALQTILGKENHSGLITLLPDVKSLTLIKRLHMIQRLALLLHDAGKNDRDNHNSLWQQCSEQISVTTLLHEAFEQQCADLSKDYEHVDHAKVSLKIARHFLACHQNEFALANDEIDLISLLILDNDIFGKLFNHKVSFDMDDFKAAFNASFRLVSLLSFKFSELTYLQLLFNVYLADAGTVSTVRRNIAQYHELHEKLKDISLDYDQALQLIDAHAQTLGGVREPSRCNYK